MVVRAPPWWLSRCPSRSRPLDAVGGSFAARAPDIADETFQQVIAEIDALLPGDAPLAERISAFRARFAIPAEKLDDVFVAALEECRRRTLGGEIICEVW